MTSAISEFATVNRLFRPGAWRRKCFFPAAEHNLFARINVSFRFGFGWTRLGRGRIYQQQYHRRIARCSVNTATSARITAAMTTTWSTLNDWPYLCSSDVFLVMRAYVKDDKMYLLSFVTLEKITVLSVYFLLKKSVDFLCSKIIR